MAPCCVSSPARNFPEAERKGEGREENGDYHWIDEHTAGRMM